MIAVLALSSIDITYEWLSPLPPGGESLTPTEWYDGAGLRYGVLMLANREPLGPASGLSFDVHIPALFPRPLYAAAGPEGASSASACGSSRSWRGRPRYTAEPTIDEATFRYWRKAV